MQDKENKRRQLIEDMGDLMHEHGLPHMAGRVIGALLVCRGEELSHDDLVDELQASKGSISMTTQLLLRIGVIDRISVPGHRKRYYRIRENLWERLFLDRGDHLQRHLDMVQQGLDVLRDEPLERKRQLIEMQVFFDFVAQELPGISARWAALRDTRLRERLNNDA